jgi:hypothetical protein
MKTTNSYPKVPLTPKGPRAESKVNAQNIFFFLIIIYLFKFVFPLNYIYMKLLIYCQKIKLLKLHNELFDVFIHKTKFSDDSKPTSIISVF